MRRMALKFAANISTMFKEQNFLDRFQAAKEAGFHAVECQFPYDYPEDAIAAARDKAGVEHVLINSYPGNMETGDFGFAAKPHYEKEFLSSVDLSIKYAKALNCKRIHIIAGLLSKYLQDTEVEQTYIENLRTSVDHLKKEEIIGLIEPICPAVKPQYFLENFQKAVEYIKQIGSPYIKLQLDIFHLQMISGNLTNNIKDLFPHVGHIQISQVPNRYEPNAAGEVNYQYILPLLEELGYDGWIGLEYIPQGDTVSGLKWIKEYGYNL